MKMQGFGSGRLVLTPKIYRDIPIDSQGIVSYTTLTLLKQLIAELKTLVLASSEIAWTIMPPHRAVHQVNGDAQPWLSKSGCYVDSGHRSTLGRTNDDPNMLTK